MQCNSPISFTIVASHATLLTAVTVRERSSLHRKIRHLAKPSAPPPSRDATGYQKEAGIISDSIFIFLKTLKIYLCSIQEEL